MLIIEKAIGLLPDRMRPFYDACSLYISAFSTLPDIWWEHHREEFPRHFIHFDLLDHPPFERLIGPFDIVEARFGRKKILEMGILPWTIEGRYEKLCAAFTSRDMAEIAIQSSIISHYVGDAHMPLHMTKDWDGRAPGQQGLHFRWETVMPSMMLRPYQIKSEAAMPLTNALEAALNWCKQAYAHNEAIFAAEDRAHKIDPGHTFNYYKAICEDTAHIMIEQTKAAVEALAGVYVSAWEQAGCPELPDKCPDLLWGK